MKTCFRVCFLFLALNTPFNTSFAAEYTIEPFVSGLSHPWAIAFLPGSDMLVTERSGQIRRISDGLLQDQAIQNAPETYVAGQGGYFDIILDPAFESNQRLYLSYATGDKKHNALQVIAATLVNNTLEKVSSIFIS